MIFSHFSCLKFKNKSLRFTIVNVSKHKIISKLLTESSGYVYTHKNYTNSVPQTITSTEYGVLFISSLGQSVIDKVSSQISPVLNDNISYNFLSLMVLNKFTDLINILNDNKSSYSFQSDNIVNIKIKQRVHNIPKQEGFEKNIFEIASLYNTDIDNILKTLSRKIKKTKEINLNLDGDIIGLESEKIKKGHKFMHVNVFTIESILTPYIVSITYLKINNISIHEYVNIVIFNKIYESYTDTYVYRQKVNLYPQTNKVLEPIYQTTIKSDSKTLFHMRNSIRMSDFKTKKVKILIK